MQVYYIPNDDLVMKPKLMFNLQDCGIASQCGYASTLAAGFGGNAFDKTSTPIVANAKERAHMAATLDPLHVPPRPWHIIGLDFLTQIPKDVSYRH